MVSGITPAANGRDRLFTPNGPGVGAAVRILSWVLLIQLAGLSRHWSALVSKLAGSAMHRPDPQCVDADADELQYPRRLAKITFSQLGAVIV